jgi:peptidoglycan/xylan/chitin deacetylase (PgdA/CDA1 family)
MDFSFFYARAVPIFRSIAPRAVWSAEINLPALLLTFDDGPHPLYTAALLELLRERGVKATFFVLGKNLVSNEAREVLSVMNQDGHCIGIHGFSHRSFISMTKRQLEEELFSTRAILAETLGSNPRRLIPVRPPYGFFLPWHGDWLEEWGFKLVICDVLPGDWAAHLTVPQIVHRALRDAKIPGAIVALHDGNPIAGAKVVGVTLQLLDIFKDKTFLTVDQLRIVR